jgi:prevent-host-death family protein
MDAPVMRLCSVEQARVELADVLHRVAYLGEHVTVYRCGERLGVIVPVEEYERSFGSDEAYSQATDAPNAD